MKIGQRVKLTLAVSFSESGYSIPLGSRKIIVTGKVVDIDDKRVYIDTYRGIRPVMLCTVIKTT